MPRRIAPCCGRPWVYCECSEEATARAVIRKRAEIDCPPVELDPNANVGEPPF